MTKGSVPFIILGQFAGGESDSEIRHVLSVEVVGAIPITSILTHRFLVTEDLFSGYTIVYRLEDGMTDVYCNRCEKWVFTSEDTEELGVREFYSCVIDAHKSETVRFK